MSKKTSKWWTSVKTSKLPPTLLPRYGHIFKSPSLLYKFRLTGDLHLHLIILPSTEGLVLPKCLPGCVLHLHPLLDDAGGVPPRHERDKVWWRRLEVMTMRYLLDLPVSLRLGLVPGDEGLVGPPEIPAYFIRIDFWLSLSWLVIENAREKNPWHLPFYFCRSNK